MRYLMSLLIVVGVCGCEKRHESPQTFVSDDSEYKVAILLDLSGSFEHMMCDDGKAHQFAMRVLDHYFRERLGNNDKLIIAQISGTERSLLWEGTPLQLRREFPSAKAFGEFLRSKSDPRGSLVHDSIAHTVEYVASDPAVASGRAKSAVFVLSDMLDNGVNQESEQRVIGALTEYAQQNGAVGLYYVDQLLVPQWRKNLQDAGIREICVESEIVGTPRLPNFE
ncbi:hypothetical protein Pan241w_35980 [Gimesia alba]|uniref:VWFA domain-containing protein n=1 Tax=Gimesia alba TaxID=2527973 RepID=A0A517RHZ8_9PLAN|nr:hypothetical protein [Gimesia alba]QDT43497.1 hypothetical protein Pan241w_35980 [Gimesia alba]